MNAWKLAPRQVKTARYQKGLSGFSREKWLVPSEKISAYSFSPLKMGIFPPVKPVKTKI